MSRRQRGTGSVFPCARGRMRATRSLGPSMISVKSVGGRYYGETLRHLRPLNFEAEARAGAIQIDCRMEPRRDCSC